jgi:hypothetical protein
MENLSRPVRSVKIPLTVAVPAYLRDHRYEGRIVFPAVEALQILAGSLPDDLSGCDIRLQEGGVFSHLLPLDPEADTFDAFHEISFFPDGRRHSRLTTLRSGRKTHLTRGIEHVSVCFLSKNPQCARPGSDIQRSCVEAVVKEEAPFSFSSRRLYADLVPFGPAYHNAVGEVCLTPSGGWADVSGGDFREAVGPLGSPFPFDAAMHLACAWGQRFRDVVAFPVGFDRREILSPTSAGETYRCRVLPLQDEGAVLRFDVRLFGNHDRPAEIILGLRMRDVSGGRIKPPAWVREGV